MRGLLPAASHSLIQQRVEAGSRMSTGMKRGFGSLSESRGTMRQLAAHTTLFSATTMTQMSVIRQRQQAQEASMSRL